MNALVLLYLLIVAPKLLLDRCRGKRHPGFLQRLGFGLPCVEEPLIWIHAVSVGEVKAASALIDELRGLGARSIFLTTTTATGLEEAKRQSKADYCAYSPIDLSWVVRRFLKKLKVTHYFVIESDFWPNLLKELKRNHVATALVSGKMSERSFKRFCFVSFFAERLFSYFDWIAVQNEAYLKAFSHFAPQGKIYVGGNLKFDLKPQEISEAFVLSKKAITIACTHPGEEELLLNALFTTDYFLILAPRHPERMKAVEELLQRKNISYTKWQERNVENTQVLLVDEMGKLPICYSSSEIAILGGSFVQNIGGHNLFEPLLYGAPVLFGPYTEGQKQMREFVVKSKAGRAVELADLKKQVEHWIARKEEAVKAGETLLQEVRGAANRTLSFQSLRLNQEVC